MEHKSSLYFPVYGYEIIFVITDNVEESRRKMDDKFGAPDTRLANALALHSGCDDRPLSALFIPLDCSVGVIAHECFHAIYHMFGYVGAKMDNENVAYHLEYLLDAIIKFRFHCDVKKRKK